jgi:hypothetical protein
MTDVCYFFEELDNVQICVRREHSVLSDNLLIDNGTEIQQPEQGIGIEEGENAQHERVKNKWKMDIVEDRLILTTEMNARNKACWHG